MLSPIILFLSIIIDRIFGELPEKIHPTVWIGNIISFFEKILKSTHSKNKYKDFIFGTLTTISVLFIVFGAIYGVEILINNIQNIYIKYIVYSFLISTTIGYKSLLQFSKTPLNHIKNKDIESAKKSVQCIVSRNTDKLDTKHILSASIESASENITDSIIAPLFYAIFFGLEGAFIYRAINTMDAMLGYRNKKYEYYGKLPAILDDIANFIPSRISGILLVLFAPLYGGNIKKALNGFIKEGHKTPSPNSGYTMAVMANSLNMTLEKIGYYKLGNGEITLKKAYNSLFSIDVVIFSFIVLYSIYYVIFYYF
ncbi:cobalamin biosynthesis protein CobD [Methanococcus aeolicus Nankai-3]|uniref:Probable cobalamin biosynthesis protein CobD n=1 Tax=Methanococcus aeolicus (strain ATCC BAA-1280 / DSM 17508 / OCM 812 / Nankai-3) TaxID=419665 RepID=COBD_META3|nr:adenosylcobinamide-phosphate synthase CbiB [Methanococcus aeolicus]A6UUW7.1 RecName: Full=Probable cobalamin biosynthesis protein CobD [Methanococcus aeolicus Nankai-3]ABR56289.1 cobalamin biosynthesis protein CobD [Methanococcus aeolicus Nankai-3]